MNIKKRIIFSRHNLRYPLFNIDDIENSLGKKFIKYRYEDKFNGKLTNKGSLLEVKFGQDLKEIIKEDIDYVFSNSMQRTYLTAKSFLLGYQALKDTKINMKYEDLKQMDLQFSLCYDDDSIIDAKYTEQIDKELMPLYKKMEKILNLKEGSIYKKKTYFYISSDGYLHVRGALKLANDISDLFVLMYYENFDNKDIFDSSNFINDLKAFSKAKDTFLDKIFANQLFIDKSRENIFRLINECIENEYKNVLILGHDSNICTILKSLNINFEINDNMIEKYPIASKLVFEIYEDNSYDLYYVYYHYEAIRNISNDKPIIQLLKRGQL